MTVWLLGASIVLWFLSLWIVLPPPHASLLPLAVGAPELSPWLLLTALALCAIAARSLGADATARAAFYVSFFAAVLCAYPLVRAPFVLVTFDQAMENGLGRDYQSQIPANAAAVFRSHAVSVRDFALGIGRSDALVKRGIEFATTDGTRLTLDVYRPRPAGPHPILVQLYGGAWQRGSPEDNQETAAYFASRGYLVIALDYRHAPRSTWPAQIQDVRAGLGWVIAHAEEFEGDGSRMALFGRSAGAQLALVAGYQAGAPLVRAVVSYYGPVDLAEGWRRPPRPDPLDVRSILETYLGGPPDAQPLRYRDASPVNHVDRRTPPTLLVYGARDHIVEARFGRQLNDRLRQQGAASVYLEIPWAEHAFDALPSGLSGQIALYYTERFLAWALR